MEARTTNLMLIDLMPKKTMPFIGKDLLSSSMISGRNIQVKVLNPHEITITHLVIQGLSGQNVFFELLILESE